ncbi:hypothetical protein ACFL0I_02340 [Gemmatimonadota bacterium]
MTSRTHRLGIWLLLPLLASGTACSGEGGGGGAGEGGDPGVVAALELDVAYPEAFSYLSGIRELPDGSLLAADPMSLILVRVHLDTGTGDTLGRVGEGPQEYKQPDQVLPFPGDSTLLVDLGKGQLTVVDPQGTFARGIPMSHPSEDGSLSIITPRAVDRDGFLYDQAGRSRDGGPQDSAAIVRIHPATGAQDTVAWTWLPEYRRRERGEPSPILIPMDDWAVGPQGQVAVVRANGISVDWYWPDGRVVEGPDYSFEAYGVGPAEREAEMELMASSAMMTFMETSSSGGTQNMSMSRGIPAGSGGPGIDDFAWPETLPPFRQLGTLVSPRGEAWVGRMRPVDLPLRMMVFDEEGIRRGYVELPPASRLIGFGEGAGGEELAYLVRTDELGLKWLGRYRILRR